MNDSWSTTDTSVLEGISELMDLSENMNDTDLDEALAYVVRLITKPNVPAAAVAPLIVKLQSMSLLFKMKAKDYMIFDKSEANNKKKNIYMSASEELQGVVDALKYLVKNF